MNIKKIVILYHGNCSDGFGGAWAAYKKFGNKADYIAFSHLNEPKIFENKEIYFIDFIYKSESLIKKLLKTNERVTAIDHHITAKNLVALTQNYSYDINSSGAVLAWKYFHPQKPVPKLLKYIEDFDLWRFYLPYTKEVMTYLGSADFSFIKWNKLADDFEKAGARKKYIEKGGIAWQHEKKIMAEMAEENKYLVKFNGHKVFAINAPHHFASYLGHSLVKEKPPLAIIWSQKGDEIKVSLRSSGEVDVGLLAKKYGGGGHKSAAGFAVNGWKKIPWTPIK